MILDGKRVLVTGGTGSLGNVLVRRILDGEMGKPESVTVFSRSEAKQHTMQVAFNDDRLKFRLGDVGLDYHSVVGSLRNADIVLHCAAHKQVVSAEYTPITAVQTNIIGAVNIVTAICDLGLPVEHVVFVSTDKSCMPANLYGATKYVQERIFTEANLECDTRFVGVRYGNVLASMGSVIPLFHDQIKNGGPVTITDSSMTRFLMSLDRAVDTIFAALLQARRGEIFVPSMMSAKITDLADVLIDGRDVTTKIIGVRPGEKIHEALISDEESTRTVRRGSYFAIMSALPELQVSDLMGDQFIEHELNSTESMLSREELATMLRAHHLMIEDNPTFQ